MKLQTDLACFTFACLVTLTLAKFTNVKEFLKRFSKTQRAILLGVFIAMDLGFDSVPDSVPLKIVSYTMIVLLISSIYNEWGSF